MKHTVEDSYKGERTMKLLTNIVEDKEERTMTVLENTVEDG